MLDLALNDTGEYVKVREIAKRQEISEKYLGGDYTNSAYSN